MALPVFQDIEAGEWSLRDIRGAGVTREDRAAIARIRAVELQRCIDRASLHDARLCFGLDTPEMRVNGTDPDLDILTFAVFRSVDGESALLGSLVLYNVEEFPGLAPPVAVLRGMPMPGLQVPDGVDEGDLWGAIMSVILETDLTAEGGGAIDIAAYSLPDGITLPHAWVGGDIPWAEDAILLLEDRGHEVIRVDGVPVQITRMSRAGLPARELG